MAGTSTRCDAQLPPAVAREVSESTIDQSVGWRTVKTDHVDDQILIAF